jgi:outer membrane immunogenic protein
MKSLSFFTFAALLALPSIAQAQDEGSAPFTGFHVGIDANRTDTEVKQDGAPKARKGVNRVSYSVIRLSAGYDAAIAPGVILGVETGVGVNKARRITQPSLAGGVFRYQPRIGYDATARIGFTPSSKLLIYGRGGYRWLRGDRQISGQVIGNSRIKRTDGGITYGAGIEYAVSPSFGLRTEFNRTNYSRNLTQNIVSVGAQIRF